MTKPEKIAEPSLEKQILKKLNKILETKKVGLIVNSDDRHVAVVTWDSRADDTHSYWTRTLHAFLLGIEGEESSGFEIADSLCKHASFSLENMSWHEVSVNVVVAKAFQSLGLLELRSCKSLEEMMLKIDIMFPNV